MKFYQWKWGGGDKNQYVRLQQSSPNTPQFYPLLCYNNDMKETQTPTQLHIFSHNESDEDVYDRVYPKSSLYLDKAINSTSSERTLAYARKACKIDPNNFGAKMFYLDMDEHSIFWRLDYCRQCIQEIKNLLETNGVFTEQNEGKFYTLYAETCSYLFFLHHLIDILCNLGRFHEAIEYCLESLRLDTDDHYRIKNMLLRICIIIEKHDLAQEIIDQVPDLTAYTDLESDQCEFILLKMILAYKMNNLDLIAPLMSQINSINEFFLERLILDAPLKTVMDQGPDVLELLSDTFRDDDPRWEDLEEVQRRKDLDREDDGKKVDANYVISKNRQVLGLVPYFSDYIEEHYEFEPD